MPFGVFLLSSSRYFLLCKKRYKMAAETYHIPVMLQECIDNLAIKPDGVYIDLTMGGGGHTREILKHLGPKGHLYSLDQDPDAAANAPDDERHTFVASNFRFVRGAMRLRGVEHVDGILADLGVSSHHFDAKHRGFSFRGEALLDMRMNTRGGRTAADIVNTYTNDALSRIFAEYGELDTTWKIANCIERARNVEAVYDVGCCALATSVHTHIQARLATEREAAVLSIEVVRRYAEVGKYAINLLHATKTHCSTHKPKVRGHEGKPWVGRSICRCVRVLVEGVEATLGT